MRALLITFVILVALGICVVYVTNIIDSPCKVLNKISKNKTQVTMLLERLTFFVKEPTYLSKFKQIRDYPHIATRHFYEIDYSLGINWDTLGIPPRVATFSFIGKFEDPLNYSFLKVEEIRVITVGYGARHRLIFKLKDDKHDFTESVSKLIRNLEISVVCEK